MREPSVRRRHDGECACAARCNAAATVHFARPPQLFRSFLCALHADKAAAGQQRTEFPTGAVKLDELMRRQQRQPRILGRHVLDCDARDREGRQRQTPRRSRRGQSRGSSGFIIFIIRQEAAAAACRWRALGGVNCVCMMSGINPVLLGMTSTFALCDEHI